MANAIQQAKLDALIARSGLNDRELGHLLGVSQPTAWRLRNGKTAKISLYINILEKNLENQPSRALSDDEVMSDLAAYAQRVPALRDALSSLHRLIHINE